MKLIKTYESFLNEAKQVGVDFLNENLEKLEGKIAKLLTQRKTIEVKLAQ